MTSAAVRGTKPLIWPFDVTGTGRLLTCPARPLLDVVAKTRELRQHGVLHAERVMRASSTPICALLDIRPVLQGSAIRSWIGCTASCAGMSKWSVGTMWALAISRRSRPLRVSTALEDRLLLQHLHLGSS